LYPPTVACDESASMACGAGDPRYRLERERRHAAPGERLDAGVIRKRLEKGDQQLARSGVARARRATACAP
jgi:hypothetical protein